MLIDRVRAAEDPLGREQGVEALLDQIRNADLLRFTTAGSVDDGKSTLIGRLLHDSKQIYDDHLDAVRRDSLRLNRGITDLALLTDGLKAEREQGITIDVAYRYFSTPRRRFIIADTPGHEQYTRNMATGASTAGLAVILIDAAHGVTTQSKRHGFIASLLGIPHVLVAVNKMDLVGYSQSVYEAIHREYVDFSARLGLKDVSYIPISALVGDNVVNRSMNMPWYDGATFLGCLESVEIGGDRNLVDFRFPVQYVNRPSADHRGYCGTVLSGVVRKGDEIVALPSGKSSRVASITTWDGERDRAYPPQSVTIRLEDELDVSRGDVLVRPRNLPRMDRRVEAMVVWMGEAPMRLGVPYHVKHSTQTLRGVVTKLDYRVNPNTLRREETDELRLNEIGRISLECMRPLIYDEAARNRAMGSFILIDSFSNATVGAGMIVEWTRNRARLPGAGREAPVSDNIRAERSLVTGEARRARLGQRPATIWLTGLSGSGKSSIARALEERLFSLGHLACVLDGDNVRSGLNRDLGFSATDRSENVRRIAEVSRLFNDAGLIAVSSFISPYFADRERAREIVGQEFFIEVFVDAPLAICERRDPKGLYGKARQGLIDSFTGISAPYEAPLRPDLTLDTAARGLEECVDELIALLRERNILAG